MTFTVNPESMRKLMLAIDKAEAGTQGTINKIMTTLDQMQMQGRARGAVDMKKDEISGVHKQRLRPMLQNLREHVDSTSKKVSAQEDSAAQMVKAIGPDTGGSGMRQRYEQL